MSNASQYADYGITVPPPELDFQRLLARTQAIVYEMHEKKQLIAHLEAAGVEVHAGVGEARFVDPHTVEVPDGRQFRGEQLHPVRRRPRPAARLPRRGAGADPQRHLALAEAAALGGHRGRRGDRLPACDHFQCLRVRR